MSELQEKRVTLRDVAELVDVSYQTVWRVVNERPNVAASTREKVLKAVAQLKFQPVQHLPLETTVMQPEQKRVIQLISYELGYNELHSWIMRWAQHYGYAVLVIEEKDTDSEQALTEALANSGIIIDGILFEIPYPHLSYEKLIEVCDGRPFVFIKCEPGTKMPAVMIDQRYGIAQAVTRLLEMGHRDFAEIHGPLDHIDARIRHDTLVELLEQQQLPLRLSDGGEFRVSDGYKAAQRLLKAQHPFSALIVANDEMALGALRALHESGIQVPEDVSVVGFDDIRQARFYEPPLTTVCQDFNALAKQSVEYLIEMIENKNTPVHQRVLYPELIVRESTSIAQIAG